MADDLVKLARRVARATTPGDALEAVVELRRHAEAMEAAEARRARAAGWSWTRIGAAVGMSRQGAQQRYGERPRPARPREPRAPAHGGTGGLVVTGEARLVVERARRQAGALGSDEVGAAHILVALLSERGDGPAVDALLAADVAVDDARERVTGMLHSQASPPGSRRRAPVSDKARDVLEQSMREAVRRGDAHLGVEHLLLAVSRSGGEVAEMLAQLGATPDAIDRGLDRA